MLDKLFLRVYVVTSHFLTPLGFNLDHAPSNLRPRMTAPGSRLIPPTAQYLGDQDLWLLDHALTLDHC